MHINPCQMKILFADLLILKSSQNSYAPNWSLKSFNSNSSYNLQNQQNRKTANKMVTVMMRFLNISLQ